MTLYRNEIAHNERDEWVSDTHTMHEQDRAKAEQERWHDHTGPDGDDIR